jgi:uncharacterized membrane protein YdjX (TVP38/TMEM64 family)
MMEWINNALTPMSMPDWGLAGLVLLSFLSSTLLPLSSEPALLAYLGLYPQYFWLAIGFASLGNTLGGALNYWLGARSLVLWENAKKGGSLFERHKKIARQMQRVGPPLLLLAWLPVIGDPMCLMAGFLKLPIKSCMAYMAAGKFLRYLVLSVGFVSLEPHLKNWVLSLGSRFIQ